MPLKGLKHHRPLWIHITDQNVILRLIAERRTEKLAEMEQDRQKFDEKRAVAQEKFWELEKQRYERKKALKEQLSAQIKEIEAATAMKQGAIRRLGVKAPKETISRSESVPTLFSLFSRYTGLYQGGFSFLRAFCKIKRSGATMVCSRGDRPRSPAYDKENKTR